MSTEVDKQNIGVIVTIVGVGAFAMIAVSLAVTAMVRSEVKELSSERSSTADTQTVRDLKLGQRAALSGPAHWADRGKGLVAIPIERAMQLVGDDLRRNPHLATPSLPDKDEADGGAAPPESHGHEGDQQEQQKQSPEGNDGAKKAPAPGSSDPGAPAPGVLAPGVPAPAPQGQGGAPSKVPAPTPTAAGGAIPTPASPTPASP
jgi:hypothetical protein